MTQTSKTEKIEFYTKNKIFCENSAMMTAYEHQNDASKCWASAATHIFTTVDNGKQLVYHLCLRCASMATKHCLEDKLPFDLIGIQNTYKQEGENVEPEKVR